MLKIKKEYGYVLFIAVLLYLTQQLLFVIPVIKERSSTGIKAPTLYPRDSEIEKLNLSEDRVSSYLRAQRAHQNNVELMSVFMPVYLITGLFEPKKVAIAGAIVLFFRVLGGIGYLYGKRMFGAPFHFGELYLLYLTLIVSYNLIFKKLFNESKMTGGGLEDLN